MGWVTSGSFVLDVTRDTLLHTTRHLQWLAIALVSSIAIEVLRGPELLSIPTLLGLVVGILANAAITRLAVNDLTGHHESTAGTVQALLAASARLVGATVVVAVCGGLLLAVLVILVAIAVATLFGSSLTSVPQTPTALPSNVEATILIAGLVLLSVLIARFVPLTAVILERHEGPLALLRVSWSITRGYWVALTTLTAVGTGALFLVEPVVAPIEPIWSVVSRAVSSVLIAVFGATFYVRVTEQIPRHESTETVLPTPAT
jgi:hypothetical protein